MVFSIDGRVGGVVHTFTSYERRNMTTESLHPKDASIYRDCPDCGDVFIGTAGEVCQDCEDLANWKPPCDQCEAIGINGLLCHEIGCPNTPRDDEGGE